ncbi:MAG: gliding motility-associated C-terminal domain-containing protein [Cytophagales bacterium]
MKEKIISNLLLLGRRFLGLWVFVLSYFLCFAQKEGSWISDQRFSIAFRFDENHDLHHLYIPLEFSKGQPPTNYDYQFGSEASCYLADADSGKVRLIASGRNIWDSKGKLIEGGVLDTTNRWYGKSFATILPLEEYKQKKFISIHNRFDGRPDGVIDNHSLIYSKIEEIINNKFVVTEKGVLNKFNGCVISNMQVLSVYKHKNNIDYWLLQFDCLSKSLNIYLINSCGIRLIHKHNLESFFAIRDYNWYQFYPYPSGFFRINNYFPGKVFNDYNIYFFKFNDTNGEISMIKWLFYDWYKNRNVDMDYGGNAFTQVSAVSDDGEVIMGSKNIPYDGIGKFNVSKFNLLTDFENGDTIRPTHKKSILFNDFDIDTSRALGMNYTTIIPYLHGKIYAQVEIDGKYSYRQLFWAEVFKGKDGGIELSEFKQKSKHTYPYNGLGEGRSLEINGYNFHNLSYYRRGYRTPKLGEPKLANALVCRDDKRIAEWKDTLRADSVQIFFQGILHSRLRSDSLKYMSKTFQWPASLSTEDQYEVSFVRHLNCFSDTSKQIVHLKDVPIPPLYQASFDFDCSKEINVFHFPKNTGFSILWQNGDTSHTQILVSPKNLFFTLNAPCFTKNDSIIVNPIPTTIAINDTSINCGSMIQITAPSFPNHEYVWSNGERGTVASIINPGTYSLDAKNPCGTQQISFNVKPIPTTITINDTAIFCGTPIQLTAPKLPRHEYVWSNGDRGIEATITRPGSYVLEIKNPCGIQHALFDVKAKDLELPNVVTPNNDGLNDNFITNLPQNEKSIDLQIVNRWGVPVFKSENYQNNWPNGSVEIGIYFYHLNVSGCEQKGWVEVK